MLPARSKYWTDFIIPSFLIARKIQQPSKMKVKFKSHHNTDTPESKASLAKLKPASYDAHHCQLKWYSTHRKTANDLNLENCYNVSATDLLSQEHIKSLAAKLCCSVSEIKSLVGDHSFLIHMDVMLLESKVNLLLSYDLPLSLLKENLRIVYQASEKVLEERLTLLQDCKLLHSPHLEINKVPHLLECNSFVFTKALKYNNDQRDALEGCPDQMAYLQMRLGCTEKKARAMLNSYPLERHISNVRLKNQLDFFLNEAERSPDFVIQHRKLLAFSVSRLRHRWKVMQQAGLETEAQMVYVWCISQKEFEKQYSEHIESLTQSSCVLK